MKNVGLISKLAFLFFIFSSCSTNTENNKLIVGTWSGAEWLIDGMPSKRNIESTHFKFDDKGNYTFEYSGTKEAGTYKVENEMLFTRPASKEEIMVKITKLTKDSLVFDMNRSGQAEMLTLLRQ